MKIAYENKSNAPARPHDRFLWRWPRWIALLSLAALIGGFLLTACAVIMPGDRFTGELPLVTSPQMTLEQELRAHVEVLAGEIGERNLAHPRQLRAAEHYIAAQLSKMGYVVGWQTYTARTPRHTAETPDEHEVSNIWVEVRGSVAPEEIVVVGAHYDSANNKGVASPGANDNASGTAAVLALARRFAGASPQRTLRFVLFTCEEPPYFWTDQMGSLVYARDAKRKAENIAAMLSIETIGYFSDEEGSQDYPPLVGLAYPSEGNFIAFVGMSDAEALVKRCVGVFRAKASFPAEGAALPTLVPRIGSSDHWSFWKQGYPALMVTDTAPYRYAHYHKATDTPDKLAYEPMARVVKGLEFVVRDLAHRGP